MRMRDFRRRVGASRNCANSLLENWAGDANLVTACGKIAEVQKCSRPLHKLSHSLLDNWTALPEPLALLPWGTNLILLHKLKDPATRLWYARKTLEHGWSRAVLTVQIESRLHERSGKAITNFDRTLPPAQSDLAREVLKDPYTFDFLTLGEAAHERDLERGLVQHIQQFLLELGAGFAFVGRQVRSKWAARISRSTCCSTICGCAASWWWI